ncbi:putative Polycomb group protein ASXL3 isoform X2 [Limulus polyphemus]|uniref:Polycomb group protein ASXL3 isoform X2 n=1 Tax=Limulus polyphemus TaxID=6850 RepID=A0ABM1T6X4_LIMPO|nr:putative Polycomb group protein ASXL3 isoform X2 [Limulus polyphemus]
MQQEFAKDKQAKKKNVKTWSEAAKLVFEMHPQTPKSHNDILDEIQVTGVKDVSGSGSLVYLNAALRAQSRGPGAVFYRMSGSNSVFGLKSEIPEGTVLVEVEEDMREEPEFEETNGSKVQSPIGQKVLCIRIPPSYTKPSSSCPTLKPVDTGAPVIETQDKGDLKNGVGVLLGSDDSFDKNITNNERTTNVTEKTKVVNGDFENYLEPQENLVSKDENESDLGLSTSIQSPLSSLIGSPSQGKISQSHSQRAIKHALRQQQKRRKRNTTVASSCSPTPSISHIVMKHLSPLPGSLVGTLNSLEDSRDTETNSVSDGEKKDLSPTYSKPQTMREFLASIPGLSLKPRKCSNKKLSIAAQIAQTKKGCIDVETPDSILVNINLKALINKHTFASLPSLYQYRLVQLLPSVDRVIGSDYSVRLSALALSNEFFARACQDWQKRLAEGEFTPENQQKMKVEVEKEKGKLDPWKLKYFEPVWGKKNIPDISDQRKISSFRMGTSSTNKHVPTIKIKPVVKKNRLVPVIIKHRSPGGVTPTGLTTSLQNKVTPPKEVANGPSPLKRPTKMPSETEASPVKKQKTCILPIAPKPIATLVSIPSEEHTVSASQAVFITTLSCTEENSQSVLPQQVPIMTISHSPKFSLGTTAADSIMSLVPPLTIHSIPVVQPVNNVATTRSIVEHGPVNLERSYQICQAVLESSRNRSHFFSSGNGQIKARPGLAPVKTRSLSCPATMTSIMSSAFGMNSVALTSLVNTSLASTLIVGTPLLRPSVHYVLNETPSPPSQSSSILTACLPLATQTFTVSLSPSPTYSANNLPLCTTLTTETSSSVVTPTPVETVVRLVSEGVSQTVDTSNTQEDDTGTVLTVPMDIESDEEHSSVVVVNGSADPDVASTPEQVILLTNDMSFDSGSSTNPATLLIESDDGTIEGLLDENCKVSDAKNPRALLMTEDFDNNSAVVLSSNLINGLGTCTHMEKVDSRNDVGTLVHPPANGIYNQLPHHDDISSLLDTCF